MLFFINLFISLFCSCIFLYPFYLIKVGATRIFVLLDWILSEGLCFIFHLLTFCSCKDFDLTLILQEMHDFELSPRNRTYSDNVH